MKKILLAFDGLHFSEGSFEFARKLNEKQPILLTGVFVPLVNHASLWSYATGSGSAGSVIPLLEDDEVEEVRKNIERFQSLCEQHQIEYRVHRDYNNFAVPELKKETRYADLLILGSQTFYSSIGVDEPNDYLTEMLQQAECPVLIVPEKFSFPQSNILAFDGSESSVQAIKQFTYLFPELTANETVLVHIGDDRAPIPDEPYIKELAGRHFADLTFLKLELPSARYFPFWANEKRNSILVCGSYGRSFFSLWFRRSFVSDVIREHRMPIFISHRK